MEQILEAEVVGITTRNTPIQQWEDSIKTDLEGVREDMTRWMEIVQDRRWKAVVKVVLGPRGLRVIASMQIMF